jgi:hypothetical protein
MKKILTVLLFAICYFLFVGKVAALTFDLVAPSGTLTRGQNVTFTINIDTGGQSLTSTQIGMTYDTQYLQYVSTAPGTTFSTVSANDQGNGQLVISGSSTNGFSGTGSFAIVTFTLIATSSGSTELCVLFNPSETPTVTPQPISPVQPTSPPGQPTYTPYPFQPTSTPPSSGSTGQTTKGIILGATFLIVASGGMILFKKL